MANTSWHVSLGGRDITDLCEWGATVEETLGGSGVTTFVIQSRDFDMFGDPHTFARMPVVIWINNPYLTDTSPWYLFRGLVQTVEASFPVGMPWGKYSFHCTDYAGEILDKHYVGTPSRLLKTDGSGNKVFGNNDATRYGVFHKLAVMDPANAAIYSGLGGSPPSYHDGESAANENPYFEKQTIRSALDTISGYSGGNTQFWWDADGVFHWEVILRWWEP